MAKDLIYPNNELSHVAGMDIKPNEVEYRIPLKYRKMENLHIVFWLFKDLAWCMIWKPIGIIMILPTLIISIIIAWRTRHMMSELCHNMAISIWIMANSYWMISEFFHFDEKIVMGDITYKYLAVIPFVLGLVCLGFYYLYWRPKHKGSMETM
ncbi:MAG: hypothetical protein WBN16_03030 [Lutimonas sp.]